MDGLPAWDPGTGDGAQGAAPDPIGRPLGELLVLSGLVTESEISEALAEQERTGRRLGEILVQQGVVPRPLVRRALTEQEHGRIDLEGGFGSGLHEALVNRYRRDEPALAEAVSVPDEPVPGARRSSERPTPSPRARRMLGHLLVTSGFLTEAEVAAALEEQARSGVRLGEILLAQGLVSRTVLGNALVEQHHGEVVLEDGFGSGLRAALLDSQKRTG
jgi:hypothetical protein